LDYNSTVDSLDKYTLRPLEIAKIVFDFSNLPEKFKYNEHFAIIILDANENI
jgi:hypothetical protein